jgi:ComF family protein
MLLVRQVTDAVLAALLAPPCVCCGRVLDRPLAGAVCEACWSTLPRLHRPAECVSNRITRSAAIGEYEGTLRTLIHALKYDGRRSVATGLSRRLAACGADLLADADAVVPVPLHRRRERQRGFNQALDLARGLGRPVLQPLQRLHDTRSQVELPAHERQRNVHDAFGLVSSRPWRRPACVRDAIVVLVDDVTTTGATLDACARTLLSAGAREVRALTAARVVNGPR